jgi:hypothetical protein
MANLPFVNFAFPATGGTANRTMPDRLAEEKNVLDFGADPTGVAVCTDKIQNAVTAARADGSGVFFPNGTYKVSDSGSGSAITLNDDEDFGFYMRGTGASTITSSACPGYLVDRHLAVPNNTIGPRVFEGLAFQNSTVGATSGGGLRIGSSIGVVVRNCVLGASYGTGLTTEDSPGNSSQGIVVDTCTFAANDIASIGLVMGGSGSMTCCDFNALGRATIVYGKGISFNGNRCESSDTAFQLGVDAGGTDRGLSGFSLACQEMEGVVNFVDFMGTVTGFSLCAVGCTGHPASNAGLAGFKHNTDYAIRIRPNTAYYGEISVCNCEQYIDIGGIYMEDYAAASLGKRSYVTFTNCSPAVGSGAGVPWRIPTDSAWPRFIECISMSSNIDAPYGMRYAYARLPTGSDVREGDEFDISDGNTSTIGANVTAGGGANRIKVRWNGTHWICLPG